MPRRRATVQQAKTTETKEAAVETPISNVESKIENTDEALVTEAAHVEVAPEAPVKAARAISTDLGVVDTKEAPRPQIYQEGAPEGLILEPNDPVLIEGDDFGHFIVVKQDVYRKTFPNNARRPSYVLLYARGTQILKSQLAPAKKK